ncbi:hypothetical protein BGZ74_004241 [Mortierella antarctica]|nr:hypothetical protein BGZ74_004241 [Mortierella antarctica]
MSMSTVFALQEGPRTQRIDLGNGLIMRWSTRADADNVGELLAEAFRWEPIGPPPPPGETPGPNEVVRASGRRLLRGNSAVMSEYDYALVENTRAGPGENPIVSCACLHAVPGYYGSVHLQFGKPEVIATHPNFRKKGLVRRLFEDMIHPASDERGDLVQFILGLPHFYLQYGYTYALRTGEQKTVLPDLALIPKTDPNNTSEPFTLRTVTLDDMPYLVRMSTPDKLHRPTTEIGLVFDEAYWRFTAHDVYQTKQSVFDASRQTRIVVDAQTGKDVGVTVTSFMGHWQIDLFVLDEAVATYHQALFPVLRQLVSMAKDRYDYPDMPEDESMIDSLILGLGSHHPASKLLAPLTKPESTDRLYTRIASYPRFIRHVAPVLEERLARSALAGVSGAIELDFFRKVIGASGAGLRIVLDQGRLVEVEDWVAPSAQERVLKRLKSSSSSSSHGGRQRVYSAQFASLSFTRLLVGEIDVAQMVEQYGENSVKDAETRLLLDVLFPKVEHHIASLWW